MVVLVIAVVLAVVIGVVVGVVVGGDCDMEGQAGRSWEVGNGG